MRESYQHTQYVNTKDISTFLNGNILTSIAISSPGYQEKVQALAAGIYREENSNNFKIERSLLSKKNGIRDECSTADCCTLLSIVVILREYHRLPLYGL